MGCRQLVASSCETGEVLLLLFHPSVVPDPQPVEIIFIDAAGRLRLQRGVRSSDGRISVDTEAFADVFTQGIVVQDRRHQLAAVEELEELINSDATREAYLQSFFEAHPEFLLGTEYEHLYPHVVLTRTGKDDLIPDFILRPIDGMSHEPAIVDLKLPSQPVIQATPRREGLYANVNDGISQLRTYHRYFAESANREFVHQRLGFTAYDPRLVLVVGRSLDLDDPVARADIIKRARPVELVTYEDVLRRQKHLLDGDQSPAPSPDRGERGGRGSVHCVVSPFAPRLGP